MDSNERLFVKNFLSVRNLDLDEDGVSYMIRIPNTDITERFSNIGNVFDAFLNIKDKMDSIQSEEYYKNIMNNEGNIRHF